MSQNNVGNRRIDLLCQFLQSVSIPHHYRGRILFAEITATILTDRTTMSQMVLPGDNKSFIRQKLCKLFITLHIFSHTMNDLHHTNDVTVIRRIAYRMDP